VEIEGRRPALELRMSLAPANAPPRPHVSTGVIAPIRKRTARRGSGGAEAGYNMVVLMVGVTILAVVTAAALPMWSQAMKRENEAELISRGWQYAEAIRVFQQRHGRFPTRLEELLEVKPRSIRRLWKDPMTESGEWGLVFQGGVTPPGQDGRGRDLADAGGPGGDRDDERGGLRTPRPGEQRTVGPIMGVRSLSEEESIKVLFDEESYDKWLFTVERLGGLRLAGAGPTELVHEPTPMQPIPGREHPVLPRAEWIGKPFPEGVRPAGGQGPGGMGGGGPNQPVGPDGRPRLRGDGNRSGSRDPS
jgi:type II secretory pathway pseudopilin PulG